MLFKNYYYTLMGRKDIKSLKFKFLDSWCDTLNLMALELGSESSSADTKSSVSASATLTLFFSVSTKFQKSPTKSSVSSQRIGKLNKDPEKK